MTWRDLAACGELAMTDKALAEVFYPEVGSDKSTHHASRLHRRAKRICAQCPVRLECLEEALGHEEGRWNSEQGRWSRPLPYGVWGGQTPTERHSRNIKHYPTCRKPGCRGCRPLSDRALILEEGFQATAYKNGLLTRTEEIR